MPRQGDPGSAVLDAAGAAVGTRRKFSLEDKPKKKVCVSLGREDGSGQ